jgi:hypothetical protein
MSRPDEEWERWLRAEALAMKAEEDLAIKVDSAQAGLAPPPNASEFLTATGLRAAASLAALHMLAAWPGVSSCTRPPP